MLRAELIKDHARQCGFHLVGLARAEPLDGAHLRQWLSQGMAASMTWIEERLDQKLDPQRLLPLAKTVVMLGAGYCTSAHDYASPIALFAQGRDYHAILRDGLRALRKRLNQLAPSAAIYAQVDHGPLMEKTWAERAGLGWIGKNSLLITPQHGSRVLLAAMLLDAEVDSYDSAAQNRCGDCALCLQACPTRALVSPAVVDARNCLAFQTIEAKGDFAQNLRLHAQLAYGCEFCQNVCPWNKPNHASHDSRFEPRSLARLDLADWALLSADKFVELTQGTTVRRAGFDGLRRNALVAMGARRDAQILRIRPLLDDPCPSVQSAAAWALQASSAP